MKDISYSIYNIRKIDELSKKDTIIHDLNSTVKIIVTIIYVVMVLSMKSFDIYKVIPAILYPVSIFIFAKINPIDIFKKAIFVLPVVICISLVNLMINFSYVEFIKSCLMSFKCICTVIGALLFIVTTGMTRFSTGMRRFRISKIITTQILLLYRYIVYMMEELLKIKTAYTLRSCGKKKMKINDWGLVMGHMLLKSIDKSENVYGAMVLRGFDGEFHDTRDNKLNLIDISYLIFWSAIFILL